MQKVPYMAVVGQREVEQVKSLAHLAPELLTEQDLDVRFVVDHQHPDPHDWPPSVAAIARGRMIWNSVNASFRLSTVNRPPCCFTTIS